MSRRHCQGQFLAKEDKNNTETDSQLKEAALQLMSQDWCMTIVALAGLNQIPNAQLGTK
jgi:hypothetical protein